MNENLLNTNMVIKSVGNSIPNNINLYLNNNIENEEKYNFDNLPIYYINLEQDIYKRDLIELQLFNKEKNITRICAVNGKELSKTFFLNTKKNDYSNENMSCGELGCLLSHIKLFKKSLK